MKLYIEYSSDWNHAIVRKSYDNAELKEEVTCHDLTNIVSITELLRIVADKDYDKFSNDNLYALVWCGHKAVQDTIENNWWQVLQLYEIQRNVNSIIE